MDTVTVTADADASAEATAPAIGRRGKGRRKLALLLVPVLLGVGGALWFAGVPQKLLGGETPSRAEDASGASSAAAPPTYVELPEIVANLNGNARHPSYLKLRVKLELAAAKDEPATQAAMPKLMDLFQTYIREMRPEELRGSAGTYRLREELLARANLAVAPARVRDVLFVEMLVQ